jgi:hypothetical protein
LGPTRRSGAAVAYRLPRISYRRSPENTSSTHSGEAFSTMPHLPKRGHIGQTVNARGFTYDNCCALQPLLECQRKGQGTWIVYCCPTAAKAPDMDIGCFYFLRDLQARKRADERTRTADLLHLRVISQALLSVAWACKSRIDRGFSVPCLAHYCRVLRAG